MFFDISAYILLLGALSLSSAAEGSLIRGIKARHELTHDTDPIPLDPDFPFHSTSPVSSRITVTEIVQASTTVVVTVTVIASSSVQVSSSPSMSSSVSSASDAPSPIIVTLSSVTTMRLAPVTATSTYSLPKSTTSPTPSPTASSTSQKSGLATTAPAEIPSQEEQEKADKTDKTLIIVVAVVLGVMLIGGLLVGLYFAWYRPRQVRKAKLIALNKMRPFKIAQPPPRPARPEC